jgi:hypothetical protein
VQRVEKGQRKQVVALKQGNVKSSASLSKWAYDNMSGTCLGRIQQEPWTSASVFFSAILYMQSSGKQAYLKGKKGQLRPKFRYHVLQAIKICSSTNRSKHFLFFCKYHGKHESNASIFFSENVTAIIVKCTRMTLTFFLQL